MSFKNKVPFVRYNEDKKRDTFNVNFNPSEREIFDRAKLVIEQVKDSTALKQLAFFGAKVLQEDKNVYLLETLFKNKRKNTRTGVLDFEL